MFHFTDCVKRSEKTMSMYMQIFLDTSNIHQQYLYRTFLSLNLTYLSLSELPLSSSSSPTFPLGHPYLPDFAYATIQPQYRLSHFDLG